MFDSTTGQISNIFTIDEKDKVAPNGKTYTGTFDFKLWPPTFDAVGVGTPIAEVTGTTSATRITVDWPTPNPKNACRKPWQRG